MTWIAGIIGFLVGCAVTVGLIYLDWAAHVVKDYDGRSK